VGKEKDLRLPSFLPENNLARGGGGGGGGKKWALNFLIVEKKKKKLSRVLCLRSLKRGKDCRKEIVNLRGRKKREPGPILSSGKKERKRVDFVPA